MRISYLCRQIISNYRFLGRFYACNALLNSKSIYWLPAQRLEERVVVLKEQSGIIQLEKVLAIVALNLNYELEQAQRQNAENKNVLVACIEQLDNSLGKFQSN